MNLRLLSLLVASLGLPVRVLAGGGLTPPQVSNDFGASDLRSAVERHRFMQREELQREQAWAARRLTPAELVQLRDQVRQQWPGRVALMTPAESRSIERIPSAPVAVAAPPPVRAWPARSQRP